ncbi:DUF4123 domain-containing protein [Thauera sinica]|uniref:DUF4123 domain-containing protein n=1 Tax=Thauera sinica TaxID=2665146 RepID=A0ABW1ATK7_9RHOO|nr:DUF4123 domain-containing protein [Thauera sp. K11]
MNAFFAQAPSDLEAVVSELQTRMASQPNLQWALLIDTAFDHGTPQLLGESAINCYAGDETLNELQDLAPCLIAIDPASEAGWNRFRALIKHCNGRPMWSLVGRAGRISAIPEHWRSYLLVDVGDQEHMLLRFADTRLLGNLPALLGEQWSAFAGPLTVWLHPDRQGRMIELPMVPEGQLPTQIRLSPEQIMSFVRTAESDGHLNALWQVQPEILDRETPSHVFHDWAEAACRLADEQRIESHADRQTLVLLAVQYRGSIHENRSLTRLLELRDWVPGKLAGAILHSLDLLDLS